MDAQAQEIGEAPLPLRPPEKCRILVVDDEPSVIEIVTFFLEKHGYQVLSASNGQEALERIRVDDPDVVIMDINMPEMDGIEACRRIKRSPKTRFLPVILVTARGDTETRIQGKDAGADDFLDKPVNELELATRVRTLLRSALLYEQVENNNRELEQRVAERTAELRKAYDRLKALERVKSDIISNVSHELRTPLQHIKSSVSLLAMSDLPKAQAETIRETVGNAIEALVRLVDDMISLGEGTSLRMTQVLPSHIIMEALSQIKATYPARAEDVHADIEDSLPPVEGDARALTRVVYHLLDNALKFSEEGTEILVTAKHASEDSVQLSIKDQGIGIAKEDRDRVFEPFYQADLTSTRRYQGAGLGLALVQLILEGHDVDVSLDSEEGIGTTIWFELPAVNLE